MVERESGKGSVLWYALDGSILAYFLYYFYKIYSFLRVTHFWSDESVHAMVSGVIYNTHKIPTFFPEEVVYGQHSWPYQPLFHVLAAFIIPFGGIEGLKYFNLVLLIGFILAIYTLMRKFYGRVEAAVACLLLSLSPAIVESTVRFMVEDLSMMLFFFSFFFLVLALEKGEDNGGIGWPYVTVSGLATGLLLLSKQTGYVILAFYVVLLAWFFIRRRGSVRTVLAVVGISVVVFAPYAIWAFFNDLGLIALVKDKLVGGRQQAEYMKEVMRTFEQYDSALREFSVRFYRGNGIVISLSAFLPLFYFIKVRARDYPYNYFFLMLFCLSAVMVVWHITYSRHTVTLLPLLSFLVAYSLSRIIDKKVVQAAALVFLLAVNVYSTYSMPNYRMYWNAPPGFRHLAEKIKRDPSQGRVLTINSVDTYMYTGKPALWPHVLLKNKPLDLFKTRDSGEFRRLLKKYDVRYVFIWKRFIGPDHFRFRSYPAYLVRNCLTSYKQGAMSLMGDYGDFVLFKVIDEL
jgi:4-amino-4-deoxy-L-arabinose transferase-like glycosyltransferase